MIILLPSADSWFSFSKCKPTNRAATNRLQQWAGNIVASENAPRCMLKVMHNDKRSSQTTTITNTTTTTTTATTTGTGAPPNPAKNPRASATKTGPAYKNSGWQDGGGASAFAFLLLPLRLRLQPTQDGQRAWRAPPTAANSLAVPLTHRPTRSRQEPPRSNQTTQPPTSGSWRNVADELC